MIITVIILCVVLIISIYININLLRKIEKADDQLLEYISFVTNMQIKLNAVFSRVRQIDSKQIFETDDEVGAVFNGIKEVVLEIEELYSVEDVND
tara:strand:- start:782 stop:1066 length:285 start_codon:yes stop_codon:yes gene_type:complete